MYPTWPWKRGREEIFLRAKVVGNYLKNMIPSRQWTKPVIKISEIALERNLAVTQPTIHACVCGCLCTGAYYFSLYVCSLLYAVRNVITETDLLVFIDLFRSVNGRDSKKGWYMCRMDYPLSLFGGPEKGCYECARLEASKCLPFRPFTDLNKSINTNKSVSVITGCIQLFLTAYNKLQTNWNHTRPCTFWWTILFTFSTVSYS